MDEDTHDRLIRLDQTVSGLILDYREFKKSEREMHLRILEQLTELQKYQTRTRGYVAGVAAAAVAVMTLLGVVTPYILSLKDAG